MSSLDLDSSNCCRDGGYSNLMSSESLQIPRQIGFGTRQNETSNVSSSPKLFVKKLSSDAILPTRGSPGAAGCDISAARDGFVPARGKALVPTDLSIAVPRGTYGRLAPRSGLALKYSIQVGAGGNYIHNKHTHRHTRYLTIFHNKHIYLNQSSCTNYINLFILNL